MADETPRLISYALVGCGMIGAAHLNGLRLLREAGIHNFSLNAVCDRSLERAKSFAALAVRSLKFEPHVYTDCREMLDKESLDAVNLCTVHDTHYDLGAEILKSGVHLLVEKPLALTIDSGRALIRVAEQSGKILATAENYRRQPYFRMLNSVLEQEILGRINTVILLDSSFSNLIIENTDWRHLKSRCGAGMVTDRGIHHADLFEHFFGPIEEIYGAVSVLSPERYTFDREGKLLRSLRCDAEDTGSGLLKFRNGTTGLWHMTAAGHGDWFDEMDWCFLGTKGSMRGGNLALDDGRRYAKEQLISHFMNNLCTDQKEKWFPRGVSDAFAIEQQDFFESIIKQTRPEVDGPRGLRAMAVCYALCESSWTGKAVKVVDIERGHLGEFQRAINSAVGIE